MAPGDGPAAARSLAAAFYDDPHARWVLRDDERRRAQLERIYAHMIDRVWLARGEGHVVGDLSGAALWMGPGQWRLPPAEQLRLLPALARVARGASARMLRALAYMERRHPRRPHWYLPLVGVAPQAQGRGHGAALLRPVLERCDADGLPAYLEASSARSRALYERLGFGVTAEVTYATGAPPLWLMWRPASRASRAGVSSSMVAKKPPTASMRWSTDSAR